MKLFSLWEIKISLQCGTKEVKKVCKWPTESKEGGWCFVWGIDLSRCSFEGTVFPFLLKVKTVVVTKYVIGTQFWFEEDPKIGHI